MNKSAGLMGSAAGQVNWKVPAAFAGRVLTPATATARNILGLLPLVVLIGPVVVSFLLMQAASWRPDSMTLATACGVVLAGVAAFVVLMCGDWRPGTAYVLALLRRQCRERPDALV